MPAGVVLVMGAFDPPHFGHALLLRKAEEFGVLTVGVNSDRFYRQIAGYTDV